MAAQAALNGSDRFWQTKYNSAFNRSDRLDVTIAIADAL